MKMTTLKNLIQKYKGFTTIAAIFILVVLSLAGGFVLNLSTRMAASTSMTIDATRAYFACKSGIEWGTYQIVHNGYAANTCFSTQNFSLTQQGLKNFNVQVTCTAVQYQESGNNFNVYNITATASRGTLGTDYDYVTRTLAVTAVIS